MTYVLPNILLKGISEESLENALACLKDSIERDPKPGYICGYKRGDTWFTAYRRYDKNSSLIIKQET